MNYISGNFLLLSSQANFIAKTVMKDAGCKDISKGIDFNEYMTVLEGSTINFDQYLKFVKTVGRRMTVTQEASASLRLSALERPNPPLAV